MTKILIDKEIVELAIEWIEAQPEPRMIGASKAITALRKALEQSTEQEPVMSERESVAVWLEKNCDEQYLADRVRVGDHAKEKATKKRQFQCGSDSHLSPSLVGVDEIDSTTQKQEPVAWLSKGGKGIWFHKPDASLNAIPLYTQPQKAIHLERLCRIMGTFDLASGHADTMDEALDSLESELRDVLGHYREALEQAQRCQNCLSLETQNTELDAKLAAHEHERKDFAVHAVDIARRAVEEEREACAMVCEKTNSFSDYYGVRVELICAEAIRARGIA